MTYAELANAILKFNDDQLCATVTVELALSDECPTGELRFYPFDGILDKDHPVIHVSDF